MVFGCVIIVRLNWWRCKVVGSARGARRTLPFDHNLDLSAPIKKEISHRPQLITLISLFQTPPKWWQPPEESAANAVPCKRQENYWRWQTPTRISLPIIRFIRWGWFICRERNWRGSHLGAGGTALDLWHNQGYNMRKIGGCIAARSRPETGNGARHLHHGPIGPSIRHRRTMETRRTSAGPKHEGVEDMGCMGRNKTGGKTTTFNILDHFNFFLFSFVMLLFRSSCFGLKCFR